jgi:RHS repeat-associated protein
MLSDEGFEDGGNLLLMTSIFSIKINPSPSLANNRLNGTNYDDSGNTIQTAENQIYVYDAENKMVEAKDANGNTLGTYFYDGDGKRVKKAVPNSEETIFVYDADGKLIAEYSNIVASQQEAKTSYLTNDHLGSPRILTDQNGQVISRRDFLPFGEEIQSGTGGRNSAQGYGGQDSIRQKFTLYERDNETDLDFAQARYYSYQHGRFTSIDPLLSTGEVSNPQSWNRYTYALNSPYFYTDPTGMYVCKADKTQCEQFENARLQANDNLKKIEEKYGKDSKQYEKAERALKYYGDPGKENGVVVVASTKIGGGKTTLDEKTKTVTVAFNPKQFGQEAFQALVGHEGVHVADYKDYIATGKTVNDYQAEYEGLFVQSVLGEAQYSGNYYVSTDGTKKDPPIKVELWNSSWKEVDKERDRAIKEFLAIPKSKGGLYQLTPESTKRTYFPTAPRKRRR